jgi:hypothetical protein
LHATDIRSIENPLVGIKLAGAGIEEILCGGRRVAKRKQPPDRDRLTVYLRRTSTSCAIWPSRPQSDACDKHRISLDALRRH